MMKNNSEEKNVLAKKMKKLENESKTYLLKKQPVVIRLDGRAFHTFTKGMRKPFDKILLETMQETAKLLCENIQGCKLAYTQSDEISLLLIDYDTKKSEAWFNYNVQKMVSISASSATLFFNTIFDKKINEFLCNEDIEDVENFFNIVDMYRSKLFKATFDSRVFSLPKEEVVDYFIYRQEDAMRNSIQMAAQTFFSHTELINLSCEKIKNKLLKEKNINWNNYSPAEKHGTTVIKKAMVVNSEGLIRNRWFIDYNAPIFKKEQEYINRFV